MGDKMVEGSGDVDPGSWQIPGTGILAFNFRRAVLGES